MATNSLIPIQVGNARIDVEVTQVAGTEATSGTGRAARNVTEAFTRAQDAIVEVARSTAQMIERAGETARPDRVEVEFGLSFSASGGVIMAGVAGEATLKVTLAYNIASPPSSGPVVAASPALTSAEAASSGEPADSS
jgi:Trypsin-co-occurring domain 1